MNQQQYELVNYLEQYYYLHGTIPTYETVQEKGDFPCSEKFWRDSFAFKPFREALVLRGISEKLLNSESNTILTPLQFLLVNTLLDTNDKRAERVVLKDLGIKSSLYEAWKRDPAFSSYFRQRTEVMLGDGIGEANRALIENVRSGDLGAIKYIHALTGRFNEKSNDAINVESVMIRILEIIQRHVTDKSTLLAISRDFAALAPGSPVGVGLDPPRPTLMIDSTGVTPDRVINNEPIDPEAGLL